MTEDAADGYRDALACAVQAAKLAGAHLLDECRRPNGPRLPLGHCPADEEAERLIREQLTTRFPAWSYLGEETGRLHRDDAHLWLVDPNDGTRAMQRGFRGSSVSIALLRNAVPVIGVVFAYNAPDDGGDLFAWAEGCPFTRNGALIDRRLPPDTLETGHVVAVSQSADRHPVGNAKACAPARFRDVPSIAYRLALLAVGDVDAATSLAGPGAWDYAGGHALVRQQGCTLVDQAGREVTYAADGASHTYMCFAGSATVARGLAGRNWQEIWSGGFGTSQPDPGYEPVRMRPGQHVHDAARLRRAQGCLLGQFSGDALGELVEFCTASQIAARYPDGPRLMRDGGTHSTIAGQPTDDSEMALALGRTLVQSGRYDREAVALAYARWYHSRPFDVGNTTRRALSAIQQDDLRTGRAAEAASRAANVTSQSNGSMMRISPLAIFGWSLLPTTLAGFAADDTNLTNPNQVSREATGLYIVTIAASIREQLDCAAAFAFATQWAEEHCHEMEVLARVHAAASHPPSAAESSGGKQGWVVVALQHALHQLAIGASLEDGVVNTVRAGGDTDTNGAICGALLGAVWGRDAIPLQWRRAVLTCRPLAEMPGVKHPRPATYWPTDGLQLAEQLMVAGTTPEATGT